MKHGPANRSVTWPRGFRAAGVTCGIKPSGRPDLAVIAADRPAAAAAVFTRNRVPGAPVVVGKRHVRSGRLQAIVCNSGCSNVCTGKGGEADAKAMCRLTAEQVGCRAAHVLPSSTGVIGVRLPMDKVAAGIVAACTTLTSGKAADAAAATAILTTDLVTKHATRQLTLDGNQVRLGGIAKGSGMIAPNMATMLSYITTDAAIQPDLLKRALRDAANVSFNCISVDEDTSTSDTIAILASGAAENRDIKAMGKDYAAFAEALTNLCRDLAYQVVKDGEGATKVFRVHVRGAASKRDADRVGKAMVGSPLIKTAVHGGDPNWGRMVMAVGRSGAKLTPAKLNMAIGDVAVCRHGANVQQTAATARKLDRLMAAKEITFVIDLGLGDAEAEWLGCDLSREYITINADYTT